MSDPGETQNIGRKVINFTLVFLWIVFGIINIVLGGWVSFTGIIYKDYSIISSYALIFMEGILIIISLLIMFKKLNFNTLLFVPIVAGIITIIIGSKYIYDKMIITDYIAIIQYSNLIITGMLLITASCILIKNFNYKRILFISVVFIIMSVIFELIDLFNNQ
jgi:hypothetical protein